MEHVSPTPVDNPNIDQDAFLQDAYKQASVLSSNLEDLTVTDFNKLPAADESFQDVDIIGTLADETKKEAMFNAMNEISLSAETVTVEGLMATFERRQAIAAAEKARLQAEAAAEKQQQQDFYFNVIEPSTRATDKTTAEDKKDTPRLRVVGNRTTRRRTPSRPQNRRDNRQKPQTLLPTV